jgi:hypothetical protein
MHGLVLWSKGLVPISAIMTKTTDIAIPALLTIISCFYLLLDAIIIYDHISANPLLHDLELYHEFFLNPL